MRHGSLRVRFPFLFLIATQLADLPAQRLCSRDDLPARATAADLLAFGLDAAAGHGALGEERLRAAVRTARRALPEGSSARTRLDAIEPQAPIGTVRDVAREIREDLTFLPVDEAALPDGVPGYLALDEVELRHYPSYRMVRASMRRGQMSAFWPLFRHIESHAIAMTAPVQVDYAAAGEGARAKAQSMAFLYGSPDLGPTGKDGAVEVVDMPPVSVLSIGARGDERDSRLQELRERLEHWLLGQHEWQAAGPIRVMGYNSPMVHGDRRYFEVQLPVRRRESV